MTAPCMNITDMEGAGFVGMGGTKDQPLITIYFGVTAQHPKRKEAEALARLIIANAELLQIEGAGQA